MRRLLSLLLLAMLAPLAVAPAHGQSSAPRPAQVTIIQAVPGASVDVAVDSRPRADDAVVGDVLGPFELAPGDHDITFSGVDVDVATTLTLEAGASVDVVLHLPAEVDGDPVVHSYAAPTGAIGPDKARVMLAHTATVAPADVRVDGQTVFTNIANGEFADADVPAGTIEVALVPSGSSADPILGPLDVALEPRTLSMIYAFGNPRDGSMDVIAHTTSLAADGSVAPTRIDTGSAGRAQDPVEPFGGSGQTVAWTSLLVALLVAGVLVMATARRRPRAGRPTPTAR